MRGRNRPAQERLSDLGHDVAARQQRGLEWKGEMDRHDSRIQFNEERLRELASQHEKALADITQAGERCRAAGEELAGVAEKTGCFRGCAGQHRLTLETNQRALGKVEEDLKHRQESLREAGGRGFCGCPGPDPHPQRDHRARPAEAGQHHPARKTFGGKNATGGGTPAARGAAPGIHGQRGG